MAALMLKVTLITFAAGELKKVLILLYGNPFFWYSFQHLPAITTMTRLIARHLRAAITSELYPNMLTC